MKIKSNYKGFTLIELIVVAGIAAIVIGIGSFAITSKFAMRRSVDQVGEKINASLQQSKLRSARDGVEYQTVMNYDSGTQTITVESHRGDSNVGSTSYTPISSVEIEMLSEYIIVPSVMTIKFNPNGTVGDGTTTYTMGIEPTDNAQVFKCCEVVVSPLGRIDFTIGNFTDNECKPILDDEAVPSG